MNKISIVTICFNEENNIYKTMQSVTNQTYKNIEYIIKDGGSTDNTNIIIDEFLSHEININAKHIIKKDSGIYDAMNQAIDECAGDWVIFMNAGDEFASADVLEKILGNEKLYKSDILFGDVVTEDISGQSIWKADINKLPYKMPFSHQSCFMRTALLKELHFNTKYKIAADYELILRCFEKKYNFQDTDVVTSVFYLDGISSINYVAKLKEHYAVIRDHNLLTYRKKISYPFLVLIAWLKGIADQYMPKRILIFVRQLYKSYIKGYKKIDKKREAME